MAITNLVSKMFLEKFIESEMFRYLTPFFLSATVGSYISILGDSEYELITGVEWTNQNTRNAIFGVESLMIKYNLIVIYITPCGHRKSELIETKTP